MKILDQFPPNIREIRKKFPVVDVNKPIFAWGDSIFNPYGREITPDLEHHESIHMRQQGNMPEIWWYDYLRDEAFRFSQELEAYGEQYAYVKRAGIKGKLLEWGLEKMAEALSSDMYGTMCTSNEAKCKIKNFARSL